MSHLYSLKSSVAFFVLFLGTRCQADIIVDAYSDAVNDRFSNNSAFTASAFNLSGVGQTIDGLWTTAISNNVVVSVGHFAPSGTAYFYPANNPSNAPVTRQIASAQIIGATDIWIGVLDQPLPSNIAYYPIANQFLTATPSTMTTLIVEDAGPYQGLNAYMFGRSPFNENIVGDNRFAYNDQAVGRNRISGYSENVPFTSTDNDALVMYFDPPSSPNFVTSEAFFQGGDSGGPTFVDISGQLVLLGTNAFIDRINVGGIDTDVSGINYLGNQASAIQSFIQMNAIPEPSAMSILAIVGTTMVARSRRRNLS